MLHALRSGHQVDPLLGFKLAQDAELSAIEQASALRMVRPQVIARRPDLLAAALTSSADLLRLAAVQQAAYIPTPLKPTMLAPLLDDARRAIRVAAARALGPAIAKVKASQAVLEELDLSLAQIAWRGEGRLMLSEQALQSGDTDQAIKQLLKALDIDPFFMGSYLNLADIYRLLGDEVKVLETLHSGIQHISAAGPLLYSKALTLIRQGDYLGAIDPLQMACELDPLNPDYALVRLLALQKVGRVTQALTLLEAMPVSLRTEPRIAALVRSLRQSQ
jgi:tetratricopeptide (TPR) repeat protein